MASQHTSKIKVLRVVSRFIPVLAVITVLFAPAALGQVRARSQRHPASGGSIQRSANSIASDASLFLPIVTYDSGGKGSSSVTVGDVNGDGHPDLVVTNSTSSTVTVLLGKGDGTFEAPVSYNPGGANPWSVAIRDVNGDGHPDLVVANYFGGVGVLLGNGDGTFRTPVTYNTGGTFPFSVAVADLNGDGKPDIVVANWCPSSGACSNGVLGVLVGNGDGTFRAPVVYNSGGYQAYSVAIGDVNGDGHPDLVVANNCQSEGNCGSGAVAVLLGNGDGTFQAPVSYGAGGSGSESVLIGDVNGDGYLDLVVANGCVGFNECYSGGGVGVLLGNGDGTFQTAVSYGSGGYKAFSVALADVNGDGHPDLAVANVLSNSVGVLLGYGDGTFQPAITFDSGGNGAYSVALADLNGDARPDLIVANCTGNFCDGDNGEGVIGVLLNNSVPPNPTSTLLTSLPNTSVYGQAVTFTATVKSSAGTPTGTVQILSGSTTVRTGTLINGSVSIPVSTLPVGSDSITASYLGGSGFAPSKSTALTQIVTVATTATSLASSLNPAATGQPVTLSATVTSQYGGAATGSVVFNSGSQTLGTATLSGNVAVLTVSFSAPGTYSISAKYSGDGNNTGSTSAALSEKILAATTTILSSSLNPSFIGQAVTFTATVTSSAGTPPNGEIITFYNGTAVLGTVPLSGGSAALTTSSLPAGIFTVTASYPGDSRFAASTSPALRQVVNSTTKSATSTTFTSSLNPSIYGQKVTFTAKVTTAGAVPPTGKVVFTWQYFTETYTIGSATLNSSGVATLTKSNLNTDAYPLTAVYSGDANNLSSTSTVLNQVVLETTSAAAITASPNPSTVGQAVTFSAKITSPTVTPTGPVTFTSGKTVLGTAQLSGGKATFTTSTLPAGSTVVTVTYNGDSNIAKSTASVTQVVKQ